MCILYVSSLQATLSAREVWALSEPSRPLAETSPTLSPPPPSALSRSVSFQGTRSTFLTRLTKSSKRYYLTRGSLSIQHFPKLNFYLQRGVHNFFSIFFWRFRVCWPPLCLCRPFCIFGWCLYSNLESCHTKHVRYQLSHLSPELRHPSPNLVTHLSNKILSSTYF